MTFAAKYRPQTLSAIVGQPRAVRFLSRLIAGLQEDCSGAAALVLSGPPGSRRPFF